MSDTTEATSHVLGMPTPGDIEALKAAEAKASAAKPCSKRREPKAAMLNLILGKDGRTNAMREELSIMYLGADWNELYELLVDPAKFFAERQELWQDACQLWAGHHIDSPVECPDWKLKSPATAILEVVADVTSLDTLHALITDEVPRLEIDRALSTTVSEDRMVRRCEARFEQLASIAVDGAWYAEFANHTHTIIIHYLPPATPPRPDGRESWFVPNEENFDTVLTFVQTGTSGRLHYDIGQSSQDRAALVMDLIFHRQRLTDMLNEEVGYVYRTVQALPPGRLPKLEPQEERKLQFAVWPVSMEHDKISRAYPTIVCEGLSKTDPCYVCVDEGCVLGPDGRWYRNGVLVKCYMGAG